MIHSYRRKKKKAKHLSYKLFRGYINPYEKDIKRNIKHAILWGLGHYKDGCQDQIVPEEFQYPNPKSDLDHYKPKVTWINHSTFLVTINGINILTDPIWNNRCSPLPFLGPKRLHPFPLGLDEVPEINYIMISHNHYDHLDRSTVKKLHNYFPNILWFVPLGVAKWFKRLKINNVVELDWWESFCVSESYKFTYVPAQHFSGRKVFDQNKTLWGGWVLECFNEGSLKKSLYFVGDTGYNPVQFKEIGEYFNHFDLSLIPIGTYSPDQFMKPVHICPEEAVRIHIDVNSKLSIGTHWNTFRLSSEPQKQPPFDLYRAMDNHALQYHSFRVLDPGQAINW